MAKPFILRPLSSSQAVEVVTCRFLLHCYNRRAERDSVDYIYSFIQIRDKIGTLSDIIQADRTYEIIIGAQYCWKKIHASILGNILILGIQESGPI